MNGQRLTREAAILLAEKFIRDNGYTDREVSLDTPVVNESFELYATREEQLKRRFDTLKPKAVGAKLVGEQWTVGFEYTDAIKEKYPAGGRTTGRAVRFDAYGNNMQVMHKDLFLDILD